MSLASYRLVFVCYQQLKKLVIKGYSFCKSFYQAIFRFSCHQFGVVFVKRRVPVRLCTADGNLGKSYPLCAVTMVPVLIQGRYPIVPQRCASGAPVRFILPLAVHAYRFIRLVTDCLLFVFVWYPRRSQFDLKKKNIISFSKYGVVAE